MVPPAPGLLSTMTCCLRRTPSACAITRARASMLLPAASGTTKRMGLLADWSAPNDAAAKIIAHAHAIVRPLHPWISATCNYSPRKAAGGWNQTRGWIVVGYSKFPRAAARPQRAVRRAHHANGESDEITLALDEGCDRGLAVGLRFEHGSGSRLLHR